MRPARRETGAGGPAAGCQVFNRGSLRADPAELAVRCRAPRCTVTRVTSHVRCRWDTSVWHSHSFFVVIMSVIMNKEGERARGPDSRLKSTQRARRSQASQRRCDLSVFVAHFRVPSVCDVFSLCGACAEGAAAEAAASAGDGSVTLRVEGLRGLLSGEELRLPCMNAHSQAHVFVQAGGGGASSTEPLSVRVACEGVGKRITVYGTHLLPPGDDCLRPGEGLRRRPAGDGLRRRPAGDGLRRRPAGDRLRRQTYPGTIQDGNSHDVDRCYAKTLAMEAKPIQKC